MLLNDNRGNINVTTSIIVFLLCILISLSVAVFHQYFYYPSKDLNSKATLISEQFQGQDSFEKTAKSILNTRSDVPYLKFLDQNGVLKESFGKDIKKDGVKKFSFASADGGTIIFGLHENQQNALDSYPLVWSLLIGAVLSFLLIFLIFLESPKQGDVLKKLESAMERVSQGDFSTRMDIDSSYDEEIDILNAYQSFNRMAESLNKRLKAIESGTLEVDNPYDNIPESKDISFDGTDDNVDIKESEIGVEPNLELENENQVQQTIFSNSTDDHNENLVVESDQSNLDDIVEEVSEVSIDKEDEGIEEIKTEEAAEVVENQPGLLFQVSNNQIENSNGSASSSIESEVKEETANNFKPTIILPDNSSNIKERDVTVFVAKISDFKDLSDKLDSSELSSFLTQYRKSASSIISDYGGVIEALLQDEIVAIFNAPDVQNKPELRAISASVELLHELATMAKKRREEGKEIIAGKIGIGIKTLQFYTDSGIPDSVKEIVKNARDICDSAALWKVYVSPDLYNNVENFVESKEFLVDGNPLYSIVGVEEGVLQL